MLTYMTKDFGVPMTQADLKIADEAHKMMIEKFKIVHLCAHDNLVMQLRITRYIQSAVGQTKRHYDMMPSASTIASTNTTFDLSSRLPYRQTRGELLRFYKMLGDYSALSDAAIVTFYARKLLSDYRAQIGGVIDGPGLNWFVEERLSGDCEDDGIGRYLRWDERRVIRHVVDNVTEAA